MAARTFTAGVVATALLSTGCSSLFTSDVPAETVYWLATPSVTAAAETRDEPGLALRLRAAPGLDSDRLLVRGPGAVLNSYAGARWADNLPDVLDTVFRAVLEDSGRFRQVSSAGAGGRGDWKLDLELHAFYAVVSEARSPPEIEMVMRGYLACGGHTRPIRIRSLATARGKTLAAIAAGFQSAVDAAAATLLDQLSGPCRRRSDE